MILDRSFNPKNQQLTITYTDKGGNRQYFKKYLHHITTYEYDDNGEFDTWNGRKCNKVFKDSTQYKPNEFDILEYMYNSTRSPLYPTYFSCITERKCH